MRWCWAAFVRAGRGDGVRRLVTGASLMIVGVVLLLFEPVGGVSSCPNPGFCSSQTYRLFFLIGWPAGWWDRLTLPQLIVGLALVVTGIVLIVRARRSRVVLGGCIFGLGLVGILFLIPALPVGPILLISCAAVLLGLGVIATGAIPRTDR